MLHLYSLFLLMEPKSGSLGEGRAGPEKKALFRCEVTHLEQARGSWVFEWSEGGAMML
jgi:hypothetical protein